MRLLPLVATIITVSTLPAPAAEANEVVGIYCLIPIMEEVARKPELVMFTDEQNSIIKKPQDTMATDKNWESLEESNKILQDILQNEISLRLKSIVAKNSYFDEIFLTDHYGTIIAASNKTSDYFQADEDFFQHVITYGAGSVFISSSHADTSAKSIGQKISIPITDGGTTIGVLATITNTWYNEYFKACDDK